VGNKCDLESKREASKGEGRELADSFGKDCKFIGTSAKRSTDKYTKVEEYKGQSLNSGALKIG